MGDDYPTSNELATTESRHISQDTDRAEWDRMWAALATLFGDTSQTNDGETWQYMGTQRKRGGVWAHTFRHRCHPSTGGRLYHSIPVGVVAVEPSEWLGIGNEVYTVAPLLVVGQRVCWRERMLDGVVARIYDNSGPAQWFGVHRIRYTHCYRITLDAGLEVWGATDATVDLLPPG